MELGQDLWYGVVKKTISLPPELAQTAEKMAREEGKTLLTSTKLTIEFLNVLLKLR